MLKNLGTRLRGLRKEKGLTLVEVSQKTGVAQATLSRIETGTMIGTVESHEKIAEVLGVGLAELYAGLDSRYEQIAHTQAAGRKVTFQNKNLQIELLMTENFKKKITPLLITLQGENETPSEQNERGVEKFFYVLEGEVKVKVDQEEYTLKAGDTLYFDASLKHQIKNERARPAKVLAAVSPSKI